jgi:PKD repeat protein
MEPVERRRVLAAVGTGLAASAGRAGASGPGAESRQTGATQNDAEPTHVFTARGTGGFIGINTDSPESDGYPLPDDDGEPPVVIEGAIYPDGTWESTSVEFRTFDPGDFGLPPIDLEVDLNVPGGLSGVVDREEGLMTAEGSLEIFLPLSEFDNIDEDLEVDIELVDGTTLQSNNMVGDTEAFDTPEGSMVFVDNAYTVPATDTVVFGIDLDEVLGLPSEQPGDNWFELAFDVAFAPRPPPVVGSDAPTSVGEDMLYDDITGDGDRSIVDVQALFDNLDSDAVQDNAPAFNFSGTDPAQVSIFDVQALFSRLS